MWSKTFLPTGSKLTYHRNFRKYFVQFERAQRRGATLSILVLVLAVITPPNSYKILSQPSDDMGMMDNTMSTWWFLCGISLTLSQRNFCHPEVPRFEMQFIKHGGFQ